MAFVSSCSTTPAEPQTETIKGNVLTYQIDSIDGAETNEAEVFAHLTTPATDTNDLKATLVDIAKEANHREKMQGQQIGVRLDSTALYFKNYETGIERFTFLKQ